MKRANRTPKRWRTDITHMRMETLYLGRCQNEAMPKCAHFNGNACKSEWRTFDILSKFSLTGEGIAATCWSDVLKNVNISKEVRQKRAIIKQTKATTRTDIEFHSWDPQIPGIWSHWYHLHQCIKSKSDVAQRGPQGEKPGTRNPTTRFKLRPHWCKASVWEKSVGVNPEEFP